MFKMKPMVKYFDSFLFICISLCVTLIKAYPYYETCSSIPEDSNLKILETLNGKVQGECFTVPVSYSNGSVVNSDIFSWLAIPYAEKPLNQNRFKAPKPVSSWKETLNGKNWPKSCMQIVASILNKDYIQSEDCLYLNIFAPLTALTAESSTLKSILIFIHGGFIFRHLFK